MKMVRLGALVLCAALTGGCSIYPLPQDYSGTNEEEIANLTRCQIGDGAKELMIRLAQKEDSNLIYRSMSGAQFASWLIDDPRRFSDLNWAHFQGDGGHTIKFYKDTIVSIDYSLEGSEANNASADATILRTLRTGSNGAGFGISNNLSRTVKTQFRSFDTVKGLVSRPRSDCANATKVANMLFPSTGVTRAGTIIERFARKNELQNLASEKDPSVAVQTDTITYTTKSGYSASANFILPGSINDTIATDIGPKLNGSRQDQHVITILVQQSDGKSLPTMDAHGRLTRLTPRQQAEANLERVQNRNAQDAIQSIGRALSGF